MDRPEITLMLEGPPADDGHIVFAQFIRELQLFSSALNQADRQLSPHGQPASIFRVIGLSYCSPASVATASIGFSRATNGRGGPTHSHRTGAENLRPNRRLAEQLERLARV